MLNIGHRPTINNGNNLSIEVNILNFSENIYHKEMRIEFVKYLRPEEKYDTIDALIAQMHKDREKNGQNSSLNTREHCTAFPLSNYSFYTSSFTVSFACSKTVHSMY